MIVKNIKKFIWKSNIIAENYKQYLFIWIDTTIFNALKLPSRENIFYARNDIYFFERD